MLAWKNFYFHLKEKSFPLILIKVVEKFKYFYLFNQSFCQQKKKKNRGGV